MLRNPTGTACSNLIIVRSLVVIDRKLDKNADTGMFELAYKQVTPPTQPYMGQNLTLRGVKLENSKTKYNKRKPVKTKKRKLSQPTPTRVLCAEKFIFAENRPVKRTQLECASSKEDGKTKAVDKCSNQKPDDLAKENVYQEAVASIKNQNNQLDSTTWLNSAEKLKTLDAEVEHEGDNRIVKDAEFISQFPFVTEPLKQKQSPMALLKRSTSNSNIFPRIIENKIIPDAVEWRRELLHAA